MTTEAKIVTGITVGTLLLLFGAVFFFSKSASVNGQAVDESRLIRDDSSKVISDGAKLTIVEFADFQCPACAAVFPTVKQAEQEYKGRVTFVFRHYPLPQHRNGFAGAKAAEAAGKQGKFFEMGELLYGSQADWEDESSPEDKYAALAQQLQLDVNQFKKDFESNEPNDKINRDRTDGTALGVQGTPTFFFNGKMYKGRYDYQSFKNTIESYLK